MSITIKFFGKKDDLVIDADTLQGYDFSGQNLAGAIFTSVDLSKANFSGANLSRAIMTDCELFEANFSHANMTHANLNRSRAGNADFSNANMAMVVASIADFKHAIFDNANLSKSNLYRSNFQSVVFNNTNLDTTQFTCANLTEANLMKSDIRRTVFDYTVLDCTVLPKKLLCLYNYEWFISVCDDMLRIGCKCYSIEEWRNFDGNEIIDMDDYAIEFWEEFKEEILAIATAFSEQQLKKITPSKKQVA